MASGDPQQDRVILWSRVTPASPRATVPVTWVVAADPSLRRAVRRGTMPTGAARDDTAKVDVDRLQPGTTCHDLPRPATTCHDQLRAEGRDSPLGRTRTLAAGSVGRMRMAVVSCSNHADGCFDAGARIARRADLDLVVRLGDDLYEDGAGQNGSVRTPEPPTEMVSLADDRMRHAQYKRDADLQAALRQHPLVAIWDDHQTANDAWRDGAQNHQPDAEGAWLARVAAALHAGAFAEAARSLLGAGLSPPVNDGVVLTGDIHSCWAADLTPDPNNPDVASGGDNPATGEGARAVEFVGTSVSSPGVDSDTNGAVAGFLRSVNPHFKHINLHRIHHPGSDRGVGTVDAPWPIDLAQPPVRARALPEHTGQRAGRPPPSPPESRPDGAACMTHHVLRPATVTVHGFAVFDQDSREMRAAVIKATREAIAAMRWARVLEGTAEDVPRDALDAEGCFRRVPTGWGALN